jgi:acyl-CoA hydrolase
MDFIRGAALSRGGKPIIALPSTAAGGKISRIVGAAQARRRRRHHPRARALG